MFTGIIEEIGTVRSVTPGRLSLSAKIVLEGTKRGDSIAVNGVCLTVTELRTDGFTADVMPATLRRSSLGRLHAGSPVNLERAMAADGRFGGHMVSGHIDGTGTLRASRNEGNAVWLTVAAPGEILALIAPRGSVALDGVSLTVAETTADTFLVSVIPHTGGQTTLLQRRVGDILNIENDMVAKYVRLLLRQTEKAERTETGDSLAALLAGGQ